jgi:G6PDH family F420-dependent oxidoreductase
MDLGYFLSCEEYGPSDLLDQARRAQDAGFTSLWISDHFHPWNDEQGQSPFVWSMIGALSQVCDLPITTAVTCPTVRLHPVLVAQAAATSALLTGGRFTLGVGSGEALNEHVVGAGWPSADVRLGMLAEAVEIIRALWTGAVVEHRGRYFTVEHARLYSLPAQPPPIYVSGFGPKALDVAARIGDGLAAVAPDSDAVRRFKDATGGKPAVAGMKSCWAPTTEEALEIAYRLWPNEGLPGELSQVLPTPEHFMQASTLVRPDQLKMPHGPDPQPYLDAVDAYAKAGYDTLHVAAVGPHHRELIDLYAREIIPHVR